MTQTDNFLILQLGHPTLRQIASPVSDVDNASFQQWLDDLLAFVLQANGMGIAAPQVGVSQRVFIMSSRPNARYPHAPEMAPTFVINPEITWYSEATEKDWEGCLSLPGIRALVPRHQSIRVRYTSRDGETVETEYSGFLARVFQHEFDHLEGKVFIDRVEDSHDIMMEQEWQRLIASQWQTDSI